MNTCSGALMLHPLRSKATTPRRLSLVGCLVCGWLAAAPWHFGVAKRPGARALPCRWTSCVQNTPQPTRPFGWRDAPLGKRYRATDATAASPACLPFRLVNMLANSNACIARPHPPALLAGAMLADFPVAADVIAQRSQRLLSPACLSFRLVGCIRVFCPVFHHHWKRVKKRACRFSLRNRAIPQHNRIFSRGTALGRFPFWKTAREYDVMFGGALWYFFSQRPNGRGWRVARYRVCGWRLSCVRGARLVVLGPSPRVPLRGALRNVSLALALGDARPTNPRFYVTFALCHLLAVVMRGVDAAGLPTQARPSTPAVEGARPQLPHWLVRAANHRTRSLAALCLRQTSQRGPGLHPPRQSWLFVHPRASSRIHTPHHSPARTHAVPMQQRRNEGTIPTARKHTSMCAITLAPVPSLRLCCIAPPRIVIISYCNTTRSATIAVL